jgi:hypothetical protein
MDLLRAPILLALVCAFTYYLAGAHEARSTGSNPGPAWALASVVVSALVLVGLRAGWTGVLVAQVVLFLGIGVVRALREP